MVPYRMVHSKRSRHLHLSLDEAKHAVLTLPRRVTKREAIEFLKRNGDWFSKKAAKTQRKPDLLGYLRDKPFLSAYGEWFSLDFLFSSGKPAVHCDKESNRVRMNLDSSINLNPQIVSMLKQFAKDVVPEYVKVLARIRRIKVKKITIRNQRRRWGSCSDERTISLNWRLILLPPKLHDYIIFHELAHITHLDHSFKYWDLLQSYDPKTVRHDMQITRLAGSILALGRI
ncbi:MAG: hypothetical protein DF168_00775 [Candidatus Moanabacter tarae]|mgnify:CR=1 FL=1|uniref:YgjP-like metallopeptidase domain-containing protein n=1 Tax=Candidatus Moanibacter tarae TaxID=2200854 RepID=A0A2Z4ABZ2_9BACT|nr:MAG: hypothetical protein DF168_00775 [Candidatus Moanabacter tarae]